MNNNKINLIKIDEFASILFIIAILVSLYISNNQIKKLEGKKYLNTINIEYYNRYFILFILFLYLYTSIKNYEIAKYNNKDLNPYIYQIYISIITIIAGFIALYILNYNNNASIENPEI